MDDADLAIEARTLTIMAMLMTDEISRTYAELWDEPMVPYQRLTAWTFPGHDAAASNQQRTGSSDQRKGPT